MIYISPWDYHKGDSKYTNHSSNVIKEEIIKEAIYYHYKDAYCFDDIQDHCVPLFFFYISHNAVKFVSKGEV